MVCCQLRNKPSEPLKRPKSAPFFLPTVAGLEPQFQLTQHDDDVRLSTLVVVVVVVAVAVAVVVVVVVVSCVTS